MKRLLGLPGDRLVEQHGLWTVNGKPLSEPYVSASARGSGATKWTVPAGQYFLMGDDRIHSVRLAECGAPCPARP